MSLHEYSVVGHSRSKIGMWIAFAAGAIAGGLTTLAGIIATYLMATGLDFPGIILWPITGGIVFSLLFLVFDKFVWKMEKLQSLIGVPDISGEWSVSGSSFGTDNRFLTDWEGTLTISQDYEKIFVQLQTKSSGSKSKSAAIISEGLSGYRLIYSYENSPKPGESDMKAHLGHCDILIKPDLTVGDGQYYNGGGRFTQGTMKISRDT